MVEHWPAKQVICVEILVFLCQSYFVVLPQVKNQHLTAPAKRRHLDWCTSMLERLGETKRRHLGMCYPKLTFILSLPSTTKTDALDDDETPLRLTASQTDTTRGVMVSGIMGALNIAPSLHFVEPDLKLNAEEWIKVMDEYISPNCAALMESGRKFLLILDNAPSHANRLAW